MTIFISVTAALFKPLNCPVFSHCLNRKCVHLLYYWVLCLLCRSPLKTMKDHSLCTSALATRQTANRYFNDLIFFGILRVPRISKVVSAGISNHNTTSSICLQCTCVANIFALLSLHNQPLVLLVQTQCFVYNHVPCRCSSSSSGYAAFLPAPSNFNFLASS